MKRTAVISLGAVGLIAGTAYWSHPRRPAFCDNPGRTATQDQECRNYSSTSSRSSHYYGGSSYYGSSYGSRSTSVTSRGGFGSTGHAFASGG